MERSFKYNLNHLVFTEVFDETPSGRVKYLPESKNKTWWDNLFNEETKEGVYHKSLMSWDYLCTPEKLGLPGERSLTGDYYWKEYKKTIYYKPSIKLHFTVGSFTRTFNSLEEAKQFEKWITNRKGFVRLTFHGDEWKNELPDNNYSQLKLQF